MGDEMKDAIPAEVESAKNELFVAIHAALTKFTERTGLVAERVVWSVYRAHAGEAYVNYGGSGDMRACIETK